MHGKMLRAKFMILEPVFTERSRRVWAAAEALALGRGGVAAVARATGISRSTIERGLRELEAGGALAPGRTRRPGAGRKPAIDTDASLLGDLDALIEPTASGDPESPLRWTTKSVRALAAALAAMGHSVSHTLVAGLLNEQGYSLRAKHKTREGRRYSDLDAEFRYIAERVRRFQKQGQPVISVDVKGKELSEDLEPGSRPAATPRRARVHDSLVGEEGQPIPYGSFDLHRSDGWVSIGVAHDTARFGVHAIRRWWKRMGQSAYSDATSLLIAADAGGSTGARLRLWKWELQRFADQTGLSITVCHFPPGTSKWEAIEHRLFSHIVINRPGKPRADLATIVSLIGSPHSVAGLRVRSEIDRTEYPTGSAVTAEQVAQLDLRPHQFQGDWNYTLRPRSR